MGVGSEILSIKTSVISEYMENLNLYINNLQASVLFVFTLGRIIRNWCTIFLYCYLYIHVYNYIICKKVVFLEEKKTVIKSS